MQMALWQTYLRVVVAATLTTLATAQLSNTKSTDGSGSCTGNNYWYKYEYSDWQYKDTSGVTHSFPGDTLLENRYSITCADGMHTCYCGTNVDTSLDTLSTDGAYYLQATGNSGTAAATSPGVYYPQYQVVSIIYPPPGNKGQNGFTDTTMFGAVTTVGSTFTYGQSITFTEGFGDCTLACGSASQSFGGSIATSNTSAFQETFTDGTGVAIANQTTNPDAVNHDNDLILIWLNPQVTAVGVSPNVYGYSVGVAPTADGATPLPDVIGVSAVTLEANPVGMTTVPPTWLVPQTDPKSGQSVPGLAAICKNLNVAEYSAGKCTLQDQCGCTPADFAPILAQDPLLFYNGSKTVSPYPGYADPLAANVSSVAACSTLPKPPSGSNCRYVPVPAVQGGTTQQTLTLSGPDCSWCGSPVWPFYQADNQQQTNTLGFTTEEDVSFSEKAGGVGFSVALTDTWRWTQSESTGLTSGNGYTASVTLVSNTNLCGQTIDVFEDTIYHTFLFMQPGPTGTQAESCSTATATPTFSPAAGTYTSAQTVTISTPDDAYIYYTTDGTTPTTSSTLCTAYPYTFPYCTITVGASETVKAISFVPGWSVSSVGSAAYTIE